MKRDITVYLRDILYFGVNLERVWIAVKKDLPDLKRKVKKILGGF